MMGIIALPASNRFADIMAVWCVGVGGNHARWIAHGCVSTVSVPIGIAVGTAPTVIGLAKPLGLAMKSWLTTGGIILGIGMLSLLAVEVGFRLLFRQLPPQQQILLGTVRIHPFSEQPLQTNSVFKRDDPVFGSYLLPGLQEVPLTISQEFGGSFTINSYLWPAAADGPLVGFRSPPQAAPQIVALGDSFTFCFTAIKACWVDQLAVLLGEPISNLGIPATGSLSHAEVYTRYIAGMDKKPALVLWQFYPNDFNDDFGLLALRGQNIAAAEDGDTLRRWLRQNSIFYNLVQSGKTIAQLNMSRPRHQTIIGGVNYAFGSAYTEAATDMGQLNNQEGQKATETAILATKQEVEALGARFVVVVIPTWEETYAEQAALVMGSNAVNAIGEPRRRLLAFCAAHNVVCFDALPSLQGAGKQIFYGDDAHLNEMGNTVLAQALEVFLKNR
jgi:hypothetical protein